MPQILIFGDSIAYGAWDKRGGWADRLKNFLHDKTISNNHKCEYLVYNLGISGDNSKELLKRFEFEIEQRIDADEKIISIIAIGINDSQFIRSENNFRVSAQEFKSNILNLINLSLKYNLTMLFVGPTIAEELKMNPNPWDNDKVYKNEYIKKYNEIIKSVCQKNKIHFIEIFKELEKLDYKNLLEDGLHPNSQGHEKIFEIVKNYLIKNKII